MKKRVFNYTMLVRLPVDYQMKPHAPPFIQTPANFFNFLPFGINLRVKYFSLEYTTLVFIVDDAG